VHGVVFDILGPTAGEGRGRDVVRAIADEPAQSSPVVAAALNSFAALATRVHEPKQERAGPSAALDLRGSLPLAATSTMTAAAA